MRPIDLLDSTHTPKTLAGICTTCNENAKEFRDTLSRKEHAISGMCQKCQDSLFNTKEEDAF